jgi:hypothetical protein
MGGTAMIDGGNRAGTEPPRTKAVWWRFTSKKGSVDGSSASTYSCCPTILISSSYFQASMDTSNILQPESVTSVNNNNTGNPTTSHLQSLSKEKY